MKKEVSISDLINTMKIYYESIGRIEPNTRPDFENYNIKQLLACINIHKLKIIYCKKSISKNKI